LCVQEIVMSSFDPSCNADLGVKRMFVSSCCLCDSDPFEDLDSDLGQARGKVAFGPVTLTGSLPLCLSEVIQYASECDLINRAQLFIDRYEIHLVDAEGRTNASTLVATQPKVELGPRWDDGCRGVFYRVDVDVQIPAGATPSFLVIPVTTAGAKLPGQLVKGDADCCSVYVSGEATFEIFGDLTTAESDIEKFRTAIKTTIADFAGVSEDYVELSMSFDPSESRRLQRRMQEASSSFFLRATYTIVIPSSEEDLSATLVADRLSQASLDDVTEMVGEELAATGLAHTITAKEFAASVTGTKDVPLEDEDASDSANAIVIVVLLVIIVLSCFVLLTLLKIGGFICKNGPAPVEGAGAAPVKEGAGLDAPDTEPPAAYKEEEEEEKKVHV